MCGAASGQRAYRLPVLESIEPEPPGGIDRGHPHHLRLRRGPGTRGTRAVLDRALNPNSLLADPGAEATADVESLGDGDRVLESRSVPISPAVYLQIRKALAESGAQPGKGRQGPPVVDGPESEGSTEVDGVDVDHLSCGIPSCGA